MKLFSLLFVFLISVSSFSETKASNLQLAVIGDFGRWNKDSEALLNSIKQLGILNLVVPGDNLYSGTYDQAWLPWKKAGFDYTVMAIGNHTQGYAAEVKYFKMPGEYYTKTFLGGLVQYIVLNSDNVKTVKEQMVFLESELKNSQAAQIFIMYHHPSLTIASHVWTEKKEFQNLIRPLLKKYRTKITGIVNGHDHLAALYSFDDLPVLVSGAGQNRRSEKPVNNVQEKIKVKTEALFSGQPYWMLQSVENDRSEFQIVRATDSKVVCRFTLKTGQPAKVTDCKQ